MRNALLCPFSSSTPLWSITPSDGVQLEVRHAVSSHYHGALLFVERVYDGLQGVSLYRSSLSLYGERPHRGG